MIDNQQEEEAMKRFQYLSIFFVFAALLTLPVSVIAGDSPPKQNIGVTVLNTPLPVTGTVIGNVSGEVAITNGPGNPVPVAVPDPEVLRTPFRINGYESINIGDTNTSIIFEEPVPAGKRLIIEHVSVSIDGPGLTAASAKIQFSSFPSLVGGQLHIPLTWSESPRGEDFSRFTALYNLKVRLDAAPNHIFNLYCTYRNLTGIGYCEISVLGYLVDL